MQPPIDQRRVAGVALIRRTRVIPILRVPSAEEAFCAIEGVQAAGLNVIEVTLTIPGALGIIETLSKRDSGMFIGAGTVLDPETCRSAIQAGAQFIVSPALNPAVIDEAHRNGRICMPGALTPTEVFSAWQAGADIVKIFPCGLVGGPRYIRALKGPFPEIEMAPTAGVELGNVAEFIAAGAIAVGVGEKIFSRKALEARDVRTISASAREFIGAAS